MDPSRPLGIKREPDEPPKMTTIPQATPQATPATEYATPTAIFAAGDSITVATTPTTAKATPAKKATGDSITVATTSTAAKATPAKKATATPRKPATKKEAAVKTPTVPKAAAAKATAKATPKTAAKATPKSAAKATPNTNTAAGAGVTPTIATARSTGTGAGAGHPRGRPKKNASDAGTTATTAAVAAVATNTNASANKNTTTGNAASSSSPLSAAAAPSSSPIIVATANRPAPGPAAATRQQPANNNRAGRGGRGGSASGASSSTTPAKRTASRSSADAVADGRANKQRKVAGAGASTTAASKPPKPTAGPAKPSGPGPSAAAAAAAAVGTPAASGTAAGAGVKKGWSVDGQEINRRHKENDLHLLETGEFSDATIVCLKKKWKVHKMRLSTRSAWFKGAFAGSDGTGQISEINLHEHNADDIETMLRFMYADSLDDDLTHPSSLPTPITTYVTLYNLGHIFCIPLLCRDSLTLLGQYLDTKLLLLCTYSVPASGRSGVIDHSDPLLSPQSYATDLFDAIFQAYDGVSCSTKLHSLLASFLWAGRDRLFRLPGLRALVDQCPMLGTDVFKLLLGDNSSSFIPPTTIKLTNVPGGGDIDDLKAKHFGPTCSRFDHTRKTQHPDRCECCDEVFDDERWAKRVFNPFKVVVRPAAWCRRCVEGKKNPNAPERGGGWRGGIGGPFELGVVSGQGPVNLVGDREGGNGNGNGEGVKKGPLEDVVPMWRLRVGGDDE